MGRQMLRFAQHDRTDPDYENSKSGTYYARLDRAARQLECWCM